MFFEMDTSKDFSLDESELSVVLKKIDPTLTAYEIGLAFKKFD